MTFTAVLIRVLESVAFVIGSYATTNGDYQFAICVLLLVIASRVDRIGRKEDEQK